MENQVENQDQDSKFWEKLWAEASGLEKAGIVLVGIAFFGDIFIGNKDLYMLSIIMAAAGTIIGGIKKNWALVGMGGFVVLYLLLFVSDVQAIDDLMNM